MTDQFLGEIRIFAGNFAPLGWAFCNGQLIPISQNTALFSLLGTQYGGNGTSNFALPNLQGAAPLSAGQGPGLTLRVEGETGGAPAVTLIAAEMPAHTHPASANPAAGSVNGPANSAWASPGAGRGLNLYNPAAGSAPPLSAQALAVTGGGQPHNNLPPYLALNFIIATTGIFPPRT